ncbi:glycoside hydrolase family protein [Burkholderia multivorans]|uniref:glycoside hydrolase family protein n=1 Tax=Burkholderia multivorans TaxID=87883 RepID=UPI0021C08B21|nr:lysozyme [Burkholderia multivorans]
MNLILLETELRRDEGVRYYRYLDSRGIPTTGVGHNLRARPLPAGWKYPLSEAQVNQLLAEDLADTFAELDRRLSWWRKLDEVRQRIIANMAFNLGVDKLLGFKNTLASVERGAYVAAARGMRASLWYTQVGQRAERLAKAMESGVMPTA